MFLVSVVLVGCSMMCDVVCEWIFEKCDKDVLMVEYVGQKRPCKSSVARFVGSQSRIHAKQIEPVHADPQQTDNKHLTCRRDQTYRNMICLVHAPEAEYKQMMSLN
jgi:hypothetical protein